MTNFSKATLAATAMLLFVGAGCITVSGGGSSASGSDGGVFKSVDKGDHWAQKVAIPTTDGTKAAIAGVNVVTMTQDPSDPYAWYIGTSDSGMFFSYDGGNSWYQSSPITSGRVNAIAVNPKNKCVVYVTFGNTLLRTDDCSRTWSKTFIDNQATRVLTGVVIDQQNPQNVWISNSAGDILHTGDGGLSWSGAKNVGSHVISLSANLNDSRRMYAGTKSSGVWRTTDGGATWTNMADKYKTYNGSNDFYALAHGVSDPNLMIIATKYGLLRTLDDGETWKDIPLLTPAGSASIYSLVIDPRDASTIYYGTSTLFYRTTNGGLNWTTKNLPSSRTATVLKVDRADSNALYMGFTKFK
jgi:photosystem II stability/assembly factor-like uncharacterized protein